MVDLLSLALQHNEEDVLCSVELAVEAGVPTKTHILNLARIDELIANRQAAPILSGRKSRLSRRMNEKIPMKVTRFTDARITVVPRTWHEQRHAVQVAGEVWRHGRQIHG